MNILKLKPRAFCNKIRFLLRLSETVENPVMLTKYAVGRGPGAELCLHYCATPDSADLPIPPSKLWLGYGSDEGSYVRSGEVDVRQMSDILASLGVSVAEAKHPVLDLGCGGGRMIRHLRFLTARTEVWGLDISAPHIGWLKTHMSPPFRFAVTTTLPHLPFSDGYFGLVYCGSVFTHIDDLAESWFLEIRRVLVTGGVLYCTLHDEHTRERLQSEPQHNLARSLSGHALMQPGAVADIMAFGQGHDSTVFYHSRYLRAMLAPLFEIIGVVPGAYGYQTAWVLRKRA